MSHVTIPTALPPAETAFAAAGLSDREKDAARSILAGMTAEQAASLMGVDASTVASYRQRAYAKLGLDGARELTERFGTPGEKDQRAAVPAETCKRLRAQGLNETQARVLALVAEGLTTSEIAEALTIARGTVNSARANGYRLLRIHSREELAELLAAPEETGAVETESQPSEEAPESDPAAAPKRHPLVVALTCTALVLLALAGVWVAQRNRQNDPLTSTSRPSLDYPADVPFTAVSEDGTELFGVNESLQRFGRRNWVASHMGGIADLFAAYGTEGELGYAYDNADSLLYAKDGTTVIGAFKCYVEQVTTLERDRWDPRPEKTPFTAYSAQDVELFGRNKNGQCFGDRDFADRYLQGKLDLIAARGKNGMSGYVSVAEKDTAGRDHLLELPVYTSDGTTVIDMLPLSYG